MKPLDFIASHAVFRREEFAAAIGTGRAKSPLTVDSHLARYIRAGRIGRVKRGVFFAVPPDESPERAPVDFLLVASRLAPDAVLAYHSALAAHGYARSLMERFYFLSERTRGFITFRGRSFISAAPPAVLGRKRLVFTSTVELERRGLAVRATSVERTAADVLDRPELAGGLEEVWRSLETIPLLDLPMLTEYVHLRGVSTLASKVGLFLERHREQFGVSEAVLDKLRTLRPRQPHYLDRKRGGRLVAAWNLVVPAGLVEGEWEAVR